MTYPKPELAAVAAKHFLYANTPKYLFDRLIRDPTVSAISFDLSAANLLGMAHKSIESSTKLQEPPLAAYTALAAIYLQQGIDPRAIKAELSKEHRGRFWMPQLLDIFVTTYSPTSTESFVIPPACVNRLNRQPVAGSGTPATTHRFEVSCD
jgi:hypothetical protein